MAYLAIARKWRPTRFEDLVGQSHVVQTLQNAILFNRVSHAYLFSGARGVGKTSVARIFAKALRCPNAKDAIPCNECPECLAITESRSVDVAEIDGASNNGVEAVRGIRENVAYAASHGHYKIYIIDEVHMLSLSAFNALLKTLEEPPAHVIFLFATTEPQKIPLTILSRCQRFEFRRLTSPQIVERVRQILGDEKAEIGEEGLRLIATHADGSLRDALSLLDQVLSFYGTERESGELIDDKKVAAALGVSGTGQSTRLLTYVVEKEIPKALSLMAEVYGAGVDLKHFAERCLEDLRLIYLIAAHRESGTETSADELDLATSQFETLKALAERTGVTRLERMAQILGKAVSQLAWSSLPRFVLEMAVVRMTKLDLLDGIERALLKGAPMAIPTGEPAVAGAPAPAQPQAAPISAAAGSWKAFVDVVMKKRPLLGALLSHANFSMEATDRGKHVKLAFQGAFYERQAAEPKNRSDIDEQLKGFFGPGTTLTLSSDPTNTTASIEATKDAEAAALKKKALEHPTVIRMKEILGAEVVDVNVEV